MGFLSVNSDKSARQIVQLDNSLARLNRDRGDLSLTKTRLIAVQRDLANALVDYKSAFDAIVPLSRHRHNKAVSGSAAKILQSVLKPAQLGVGEATLAFSQTNQAIDSLISRIDDQVASVSALKNQIGKPRVLRGQSTAWLMSNATQQVEALRNDVIAKAPDLEVGVATVMIKSSMVSDQTFKMKEGLEVIKHPIQARISKMSRHHSSQF